MGFKLGYKGYQPYGSHTVLIHLCRDYPDFYTKLYALLEPSVFYVKYMPRFFYLMDTFLSSTYVL